MTEPPRRPLALDQAKSCASMCDSRYKRTTLAHLTGRFDWLVAKPLAVEELCFRPDAANRVYRPVYLFAQRRAPGNLSNRRLDTAEFVLWEQRTSSMNPHRPVTSPQADQSSTRHDGESSHEAGLPDEHELAWDIVEFARSRLSISELNAVFMRITSDDCVDAIDVALTALEREKAPLPDDLARRLNRWVSAYAGHPSYRRLRSLGRGHPTG